MADFDSLWGDEFELPKEKEKTKKIVDKISKPKEVKVKAEKQIKSKSISLADKLKIIEEEVYRVLGKQKENVLTIKDKQTFDDYIDKAIKAKVCAVDTETNNSLDPITCKIMGLCLYVPGEKQAYIPINHRDRETKERLAWQLTEADVKQCIQKFIDNNVFIETHNGKFDYQVIKCTCDVDMPINWDSLVAAKLLDENEKNAGLKSQYVTKIDPEQEKYDIEKLFENVEYADVDPELFALYSATDSLMTHKLKEWQYDKLIQPDLAKVYNLYQTIELPLIKVVAEMELSGMTIDLEYADLLSKKYHKKLDNLDEKINAELAKLKPQIDAWRLTPEANFHPKKKTGEGEGKSKNEQLEDPIGLASPTQLAILFYDIFKCPQVSKKAPRGTGEEELGLIAEKLNMSLCDLLIERRGIMKLLTTYIDAIPELAKMWPDHRVRTHFNQFGAATGRFSSGGKISFNIDGKITTMSGVNFQNIPSHNKEIRMLFKAKDGYRIQGSDYSGQEPRLTSFYSQDEAMINAYQTGKDLYSVIASMSFNRSYEDCLEFYPEGTELIIDGQKVKAGKKTHLNVEGKKYRTQAKSILLGVLYGRGAASVGEQIGKSKEEAQEIIDKFFKAFPKVKNWIDTTMENARKLGYVEDVAGRRRRLPDILLPKYDIKFKDQNRLLLGSFNPFLGCADRVDESSSKLLATYKAKLDKIKYAKEYEKIQADALKNGIEIHSNTGFIAQAERQAVNSRVQGGAATLTKCALLEIYNDKRLKDLGAYLVNTVHDEILIEAPEATSEITAQYLCEDMVNAAKKLVTNVPMSCDAYSETCWYLSEFVAVLEKEFKNMLETNPDSTEVFELICAKHDESTRSQIYEIVRGMLPVGYIPADIDTGYHSFDR